MDNLVLYLITSSANLYVIVYCINTLHQEYVSKSSCGINMNLNKKKKFVLKIGTNHFELFFSSQFFV